MHVVIKVTMRNVDTQKYVQKKDFKESTVETTMRTTKGIQQKRI